MQKVNQTIFLYAWVALVLIIYLIQFEPLLTALYSEITSF